MVVGERSFYFQSCASICEGFLTLIFDVDLAWQLAPESLLLRMPLATSKTLPLRMPLATSRRLLLKLPSAASELLTWEL